ncbi:metallopeptidase family protein [Rhodovulum sp. DZ06]|uniref:metallopeptidase family protein n=1 Tax=Rhodovulum sp. DZ06 TaxID=3425126 RepID=UPI003D33FEB3
MSGPAALPCGAWEAPSEDDFAALAAAAFAELPDQIRAACDGLAIRIADFADDETLDEMGIEDGFELTGLYRGVSLPEKSSMDVAPMPDEVWLYRRPILDEWAARGDVGLGALVAHVLIHEIAHHFGWSDDEIAAVDDWRL